MTLKFRFQGRTRVGANNAKALTLKYRLVSQTALTTVALTTTSSGETNLTLVPGEYLFYVKAPGYLNRRFGSTTSPILISPGDQFLDLSSLLLLGGDFNSDGIINEVDYTTAFLTNFGMSNVVVDLDASGKVNNLDFAIMRHNWNLVDDPSN